MSPLEWIAAVLGIWCVVAGARRSTWTFPTAIASVTLVGWVVWRQRLYSDALLQGFFVLANLYGWAEWRRAQAEAGEVAVERMTAAEQAIWAVGCLVATIVWSGAMARLTDAAYPWWDGATAVVSVAAQLLMAQRRIENWVLWVVVDVALIPLYLIKGLPVIAGLYLVYLALSIWGLIGWRRAERGKESFA
jgi:nicotinamide mononucleotide transporter